MTKIYCIFFLVISGIQFGQTPSNTQELPIDLSYAIHVGELNNNDSPEQPKFKDIVFKPHGTILKTHPQKAYVIRVDFLGHIEKLKTDGAWFVTTESFNKASYFYNYEGTIKEYKYGSFDTIWNLEKGIFADRVKVTPEHLINRRYIYFKLNKSIYSTNLKPGLIKAHPAMANALNIEKKRVGAYKRAIPTYLFLGMALPALALSLLLFCYTKNKDFLFYAIYLMCFVGFFGLPYFKPYTEYFGKMSRTTYVVTSWLDLGTNIFYMLFVRAFLTTGLKHPILHRIIDIGLWFIIALLLVNSVFLLFGFFSLYNTFVSLRALIMSLFIISTTIYMLTRTEDKLVYFVIFGSLFLSIGSLLLHFTGSRGLFASCAMAEMMIFGLGLVYKVKELQSQNQIIKRQAMLNEIHKLKAQINPHFIFNSLNSIQNLVFSNDQGSVLKYLDRLSFLMRNVLEGTNQAYIPLREEVEFLHSYLEMESLRFQGDFEYKIRVDEILDPDLIEIPPLLIQPFVENAIFHGLLNKIRGDKLLLVDFKKDNGYLICKIEDNGIGREKSKQLNLNLNKQKKSNGIRMIEKQLELLNEGKTKNSLKISNKYDCNNKVAGTIVTITLSME